MKPFEVTWSREAITALRDKIGRYRFPAAPADAAPLKPLQGGMLALMTIAVAFSTFMEVLDMTIVNVAVPHIAGSLAVSPSEGTWAISSYSMASAIMQPGMFLSQPPIATTPSKPCAPTTVSMESAITSRDTME